MAEKQLYDLEQLFKEVQLRAVLPDGKTFPDAIANLPLDEIEETYITEKTAAGFDLKKFIDTYFTMPAGYDDGYHSDSNRPIEEHIRLLWNFLKREPGHGGGSLINLPYPYIVPGGRFREIYYWDSYFTMLGLYEHGHIVLIENMIRNFEYLIQNYGHIPNGNRTYYLSRSQPPFFALMVELLALAKNDNQVYAVYLPALKKEHEYWLSGAGGTGSALLHTVTMPGGEILNRYYDENPQPRQESYAEDVHVSSNSNRPSKLIYTNIRAGAESGWDFSSRWFADREHIESIETINIIPVDLNFLLYKLEIVLACACEFAGEQENAALFTTAAKLRLKAILTYCWNEKLGFFTDYNWVKRVQADQVTAAGLVALFIADPAEEAISSKAAGIAMVAQRDLLRPGGIVTTTINSGQQWDAPNGWAPLQWMAVSGLQRFGQTALAITIAERWTSLNKKVFSVTGKMMEKYDVTNMDKLAGGGEYESQDGFGWTNGVYLAMNRFLTENKI